MSSEWVETTLGEVCAAQNGAIQTGPFGSQLHASDYVETGIPVVMPSNIGPDGGISEDGIARIKQEDADRLSQHKLQIGDVVFSRRGDVTRNALIEPNQVGWLCGTGCLKVRLGDERKADAKFISYCLRLPETKEWLIRHAVGATMLNLNTAILSAVPIQIPPISEQKKISNLLRALDDRITLLRETNATLEAIAQALFKSWFVDFDPVLYNSSANAGTQATSLPTEIQALFPSRLVESPQGLIPEGWEFKKFADVIDKYIDNRGKTPPTVDEGIPLLEIKHLPENEISPSVNTDKKVSQETYDTWFRAHPMKNDILMSTVGTIGRLSIMGNQRVAIAQNILGLRVGGVVAPEYMYYLMKDNKFKSDVNARLVITVQASIKRKDLNTIDVLVPSKAAQSLFIDTVSQLIEKQRMNDEQAQNLAHLRDTLLPRLISGQLRLHEAEAALVEVI